MGSYNALYMQLIARLLILLWVLFSAALVLGAIYAAIHFVIKFW